MPDIYKVTDDFRRRLLKQEREAAVEMTRAYGAVWARIKGEIDTLLAEWEQDGGVNAGPDWAYRYNRLRKLEEQIRAELTRYTEYAEGRIDEGRRAAGRLGVESVGAQLSVTAAFDRLPVEAVEQMTGMLWGNSPLKILLSELPGDGAKAAGDALLRGLALGKGVKEIARDMRAALGGNLTRALRIARTETLRAYRESTRAGYARAGVKRWEWRSARNERTCAACWAMDGKVFDVGEPMPAHVNCRCVMLPVTDTWEELGFAGIEELEQPAPALDVFANLRPDQQLMVLGPAKFGAWQAGALKLPDLVGWKEHPLWGRSVFEKGLAGLGLDTKKFWSQPRASGAFGLSHDDLITLAKNIDTELEKVTGGKQKWSGSILVQAPYAMRDAWGEKKWSCDILLRADCKPGTLIHELLHGRSTGLTQDAYRNNRGLEEGVVEQITRLFGDDILRPLGYNLGARESYQYYIDALEELRNNLGMDDKTFYLDLFQAKLSERKTILSKWYNDEGLILPDLIDLDVL